MRILVVSLECWNEQNNGGNVLSNIFDGFNDSEFAQIYLSSGLPENKICENYFQMTDGMAIQNIFHKKSMGKILTKNTIKSTEIKIDNQITSIKRKKNSELLRILRQIVWHMSDYKNENLKKFILDFKPDIIFAPCYGNTYMLSLTRYIACITNKPIISYISDDFYSLKQVRLSPFYWINKIIVRHSLKKTWRLYSLIYTMTTSQLNLMNSLGKPMKILRKSGEFNLQVLSKRINSPIRLIYAGGVYLNRHKTLECIANAIRELNVADKKFRLDIYTNNELNSNAKKILNDQENSFLHSSIPFAELTEEYQKSDIALHVESFDLKNRLNVRMSFSTKIIDCLDSGCAVMAVCDKKQAGFQYLKEENTAICVDSPKKIKPILDELSKNPEIIAKYRARAIDCGKKNHLKENIDKEIKKDFEGIVYNYEYSTNKCSRSN